MEYKGYSGTVHQLKNGGYRGRVVGISKDLTYTGMTIDSLEAAFRATVDDYIGRRRRTKGILFGILAGIAVLIGLMVVTCPGQDAHKKAVGNVVKQGLSLSAGGEKDTEGFGTLAVLLGGGIADFALTQMLEVDNYFLVSVGTITYEGKTKPLSVGILGHVFTTVSKEDVSDLLKSF